MKDDNKIKPAEESLAKARSAKGSGTTVTADLKEHPTLLEKIRNAAKADDRETSNWLRRKLVQLDTEGKLFDAK